MDRWASFDCYGTLIDWTSGIRDTLAAIWPTYDAELLLAAYHDIEPEMQGGRATPYRGVLIETLEAVARREGLGLDGDEHEALVDSLPSWPPFAEVASVLERLRDAGWRLAILSNTDPDLLDASLETIGVPVDVRVTAAEAGSYKPAHGHWDRFFEATSADPERHVHVAAPLFHDIAPCAELGLRAVWINRSGETSDLPRAAELPDLSGLPGTVEALVSAGR